MGHVHHQPNNKNNLVQHGDSKMGFLKRWRLAYRWWRERRVRAAALTAAFWYARDIEKKLQQFEQDKNNLDYAREFEQFHYMRGFCDGIKYCMEGKWHEEGDRSFIARWRDILRR